METLKTLWFFYLLVTIHQSTLGQVVISTGITLLMITLILTSVSNPANWFWRLLREV